MRFRVTQWSEPFVFLLSRRIPQRKLNRLAIELNIGDKVVENGWRVRVRELAHWAAFEA